MLITEKKQQERNTDYLDYPHLQPSFQRFPFRPLSTRLTMSLDTIHSVENYPWIQ
jgi:hypothetical protein